MNKQLIIFDMDGTLINSGDVITNTINYVRANLGLENIPKETMLKQLNNPDINAAEFFYGTSEFTDAQTELFTKYYDENCVKDISLYDGIYDLLESLKKEGYQLSVATNASSDFAIKMLKSLDIYKFFSYVVGANMVEKPKPKPDMLLKILDELNIDVKYSILIGDSLKDTRAAKAINMDAILVNWGFSKHENEISNIKELKNKLIRE
jgi:phosphoglycolate phosphatase